jgi:acyl-CoA reductase-like NAD-dependent aldehyde dehydrogenase
VLEGGGKDACLVDAGVDPAGRPQQVRSGAFANAGQICVSVERVYVHEAVADAFLDALVREAGSFDIGPLVDRRQREVVEDHVAAPSPTAPVCSPAGRPRRAPARGTRPPSSSAARTT